MRIIRFVLVFLGVLAFLVAGVALAAEIASFAADGKLLAKPLGQIWREYHKDSLLLIQPAVERYLHPWLWQSVLFPLLLLPPLAAAGVFAVLGLVLVFAARLFRRRR
jgi:hypothetical protein